MTSLKKINKINSIISFLLILVVIFSVFGLVTATSDLSSSVAQAEVWYGESLPFEWTSESDGTVSDPYRISSPANLAYLAEMVNSGTTYANKYFVLTEDLDLNNYPWTPIGNETYAFQGNFDGDSHIIKNLNVDNESYKYSALFGNIGKGATVENFILGSGSVVAENTSSYTASFASYVSEATVRYIKNEGVSVNGKTGLATGGVIGNVVSSQITGIYNYASVESIVSTTGGVFGIVDSSTLRYIINYGSLLGVSRLGGVAGYIVSSDIEALSNEGNISTMGSSDTFTNVGGIIGMASDISSLNLSGNTGDIIGGKNVGGLIGSLENTTTSLELRYSYNIGTVSSAIENAGGLIGNINANFIEAYKCYNLGNVTVPSNASYDALICNLAAVANQTFTNCYYLNSLITAALNVSPIESWRKAEMQNYFNTEDEFYFVLSNTINKNNNTRLIWELCGGGDGTESNPYYIIDELFFAKEGNRFENFTKFSFGYNVNDNSKLYFNYIQIFDIDFKQADGSYYNITKPLSYKTFNGNGRKIFNCNSSVINNTNLLFNVNTRDSIMENVNIASGKIIVSSLSTSSTGILGIANYGIIRNCYVNVDIDFVSFDGISLGFAGYVSQNYGIIENCVFAGTVDLGNLFSGIFGGIASYNCAVIKNCVSYANFINLNNYDNQKTILIAGISSSNNIDYMDTVTNNSSYIVDYYEISNCLFLGSIDYTYYAEISENIGIYPIDIYYVSSKSEYENYLNNPNSKCKNNFYLTDNLSEDALSNIEQALNQNKELELSGEIFIYDEPLALDSMDMVTKQEESKPQALKDLDDSAWEFKKNKGTSYYFPSLKNVDYNIAPITLYRAEFNDVSGDNPTIIQYVKKGEKFVRPDEQTEKAGFEIYDWYYYEGLYSPFNFDRVAFEDVVLYGKWQLIAPTVTLVSNAENNTVESGQKLILTAMTNHVLNGTYEYTWYKKDGNKEIGLNNPYQSLTISSPLDSGEYYCTVTFFYNRYNSKTTTETISATITRLIPDVDAPVINKDYNTGNVLDDVSLPDGWTWENSDTALSKGENYYNAIFTPSDLVNYQPVVKQVKINALSKTLLIVLWTLLPILICILILLLLYLIWLFWLRTYTVSFETFGGEKIDSLRFRYGESVIVPTPTKYNNEFLGWMSDFSLSTPFGGGGMPRRNITLFAKWRSVPKALYVSRKAEALPAGHSRLLALAPPDTETTITKDPDGNIIRKVKFVNNQKPEEKVNEKENINITKSDEKAVQKEILPKQQNIVSHNHVVFGYNEVAATIDKDKNKNDSKY